MSQPFCVDQLNPAGYTQCIQCALQGKLPLFFYAGNWKSKINMAEGDLSPTTFTSSSASDSDYDISLRIPLKMNTKIYIL